MSIFKVTVVLYFIKILSSSRNFYRLRMTSLTLTNVFTISCLSIEPPAPPPPPPPARVNLVLQHCAKPCKVSIALFVDYSYYSSTIRGLFADFSYCSSTIRGLFVLFVEYSHYSHYSLNYSSFINCRSEGCYWSIIFAGQLQRPEQNRKLRNF
jgi:hypothetical protein